jgi:phosphatidate cytidylyltransferase
MAQPSAPAKPGTLGLRIASALVMAPLALAAVWFGSPWFPALVTVAAVIMAWEWARLCQNGVFGLSGCVVMATTVLASFAAGTGRPGLGLVVAVLGAAICWAAGTLRRDDHPAITALGALWLAVPCVALLWLDSDPAVGRVTIVWILAIVWATDIGAYAVGRTVGGPRLAPRMSPSKTWSGLAGGALCAALAGVATALLLGLAPGRLAMVSAMLAVIAQFGDLAESMAKRRFGVKDSSSLIPGHGGLLDRVDGLLAVAPAVALLSLAGGNVLTWR